MLAFPLLASLLACAPAATREEALSHLAPLRFDGRDIPLEVASTMAPTPNVLAMDDQMRDFVANYTGAAHTDRQRLNNLHQSITSDAILNLEYEPDAEGTAGEVFRRGSANCLSYANLFVAMAREAGLDARYQWVKVRPQWSRVGERVAVRLHVNVVVNLRHGEQYVVDIDPLRPAETVSTRVLSDTDAVALYHNNLAMAALADNEIERAWAHGVRALQLSPTMSLLWVNMGAIYRIAGQHDQAERSYLYALELNSRDRSAMNNLVVLYRLDGRDEEASYWSDQIARYRQNNPWYHAWLGDKAGEAGDWAQAMMHYDDALRRSPRDSRLLFALGVIHYRLGEYREAQEYVVRAIDTARDLGNVRRSELDNYRAQLDTIVAARLAVLD